MGTLRDWTRHTVLGLPTRRDLTDLRNAAHVTPQLASPFAPTPDQLQTIVFSDVLGGDYTPLTRGVAMGVPPLARARHMLVGTIASLPLVSLTRDVVDPVQPLWCQRTDGDLSPYHRMLWTVDDLFFYGWSLWALARGAQSDGSQVAAAARVPWHRWGVGPDGVLLVDSQPVNADQVCLIPGPHGGVLNESSVSIRMAADNLQAAANAARNPVPNVDLHYTGDDEYTDDQIDAHIARWSGKRRSQTGGVAWTNKWIEAKPMGSHDGNLLVEGRNADAVDMARIGSVPASTVDASSGDSLTYTTDTTRNQQLLDYGAKLYMDAIAARLSMDDMVPRTRRIAFDVTQLTTLTPTPTGAPTDD